MADTQWRPVTLMIEMQQLVTAIQLLADDL
jgi:hypothetical protein